MNEQVKLDIDYKVLIKERLLDAYENNPLALEKILQLKNKASLSPTGTNRFFNHYYLAGILVSLCPEVTNFITVALDLNADLNAVLYSIGLNFDPVEKIEKRKEKKRQEQKFINEKKDMTENVNESTTVYPEYEIASKHLNEIREQIKRENFS